MPDDDGSPGDKPLHKPGAGRVRSDASFDRWLVGQMRKLYDQTLEESVPEDLVEIVRSFNTEAGRANAATAQKESSCSNPGNGKAPRDT